MPGQPGSSPEEIPITIQMSPEVADFATRAEQAANAVELARQEDQATANYWALRGRPAVASLLAEGLIAVEGMRVDTKNGFRLPGTTGQLALKAVHEAIIVSRQFKPIPYESLAYFTTNFDDFPREYRDNRRGILVDRKHRRFHSEYGLGLLANYVQGSESGAPSPGTRKLEITSIVNTMVLNGSLNQEITEGLATMRPVSHNINDHKKHFDNVLELARLTDTAIADKQAVEAKYKRPRAKFNRWLRRRV